MSEQIICHRKKILHFIERDKFTAGYINFMELVMNDYAHSYVVFSGKNKLDIIETANVIVINNPLELIYNKELRKALSDNDRIIVSGVFRIGNFLSFLPEPVLEKMTLHFWGGDFYSLDKCDTLKQKIRRILKLRSIKKCKNVVFLIEGEEQKFLDITGVKKDSYVAPMPGNPKVYLDYSKYCNDKAENHVILVGNSASPSNHHIEVFEWLSRYKGAHTDMKVVCPLSYGDNEYRKHVIKMGKEIFGEDFQPILDYMRLEEYYAFLSKCSYGIFNNDRQQAMGNISLMLYLGKKVFIRTDTSMWNVYKNRELTVYPAESIKDMTSEDFFYIDEKVKLNNQKNGKNYRDNKTKITRMSWERVFES